jgi:hypothetical protein
MTPKEKAEELYNKYLILIVDDIIDMKIIYGTLTHKLAKQCALISVDEVKWFHKRLFYLTEGSIFDKYLEDVKKEIEKL